jgi:hypothetical protein
MMIEKEIQKPDFYTTEEAWKKGNPKGNEKKKEKPTNPRYKEFKQTHFTAGDIEQFDEYRNMTNGQVCEVNINLKNNKFNNIDLNPIISWSKYQHLNASSVINTFKYLFHKFKKGIFVKILDGELKVFLPFSKASFINEWGNKIQIDPYWEQKVKEEKGPTFQVKILHTMKKFLEHINNMQGKKYPINILEHPDTWYGNNCLVRFESPMEEGDTNIPSMSDMLKTLCSTRKIPDMEFFVNRRDFPLIKKNSTEPYNHLFDSDNLKLLSHEYDKYSPILSMVTTPDFADIPIPTGDDWSRISSYENKFFHVFKKFPTIEDFNTSWKDKKPTAVFRGATTGCGVTIKTNNRLLASYMSPRLQPDNDYPDDPLLDAGITKWQVRPRKIQGEKYLQTIDIPNIGINLVTPLTPIQQSKYKYILHLDGHVSAFRLSLELSMGSCILKADSMYQLWYSNILKPNIHYIPIKADLSDLIEKIRWCRKNDNFCQKIAENAKIFYLTYLQKDGMLDYLQKLLIDIKKETGIYLYNEKTPLQTQLDLEKNMPIFYPLSKNNLEQLGKIPKQSRSIGLLKGLEWIINKVNTESNFSILATNPMNICSSQHQQTNIIKYNLAGFTFVVKKSTIKSKILENIHEAFLGINAINNIVKYIPNFAYIFGIYNDEQSSSNVIMEYIPGLSFEQWIKDDTKFNIKDYLFILIQICFALEVAQKLCGFVHYDLAPWNIIIQELPQPMSFDYPLENKIYRITTKLIPIIIDYGKSHVIVNNEHHGYINMYKTSTSQDIISILLTSIYDIIQTTQEKRNKNKEIRPRNLYHQDTTTIIKLANFLAGTKYTNNKTFYYESKAKHGFANIISFFHKAKKYTEMISSNKFELESKTPMDLIQYITKNVNYNFNFNITEFPHYIINQGNPRQVFHYILATTPKEKLQSFLDIFTKVIECEFPTIKNTFYAYYISQTIEENITSVYTLMNRWLISVNLNPDKYKIYYDNAITKIKTSYEAILNTYEETINYNVDDFKELKHARYVEETFLDPNEILNLLNKPENKTKTKDLSDYKHIIENILLNQGMFKLSDKHRLYYLNNFNKLLNTNSLNMKNYVTNKKTLKNTAKRIYSNDQKYLNKKIKNYKSSENNCDTAIEYLNLYEKILKI